MGTIQERLRPARPVRATSGSHAFQGGSQNVSFDYDDAAVRRMLVKLQTTAKETNRIYKKRFAAALKLIQDPAKRGVRNLPGYKTAPLAKYVRQRVYFNNKPRYQGGMVSILSDRKKGSKSFLLPIYEIGAKDRYTGGHNTTSKFVAKKSNYRGSIREGLFFKKAIENNREKAIRQIDGIVDDIIKEL